MLTSSGVDPRSGQTIDYKIGICCFSSKHTTWTSWSKDWLAQNRVNIYPLTVVSVRKQYKDPSKHVGLVQSRSGRLLINI